ncbi:MAG: hypothetical protein JWM68_5866 [Verrucomicrobiales bacterium]|nr:hypothetical protein [Verrucomicrobiales bacterium]
MIDSCRDELHFAWSNESMNNKLMAVLSGVAILVSACTTLFGADSTTLQGTWKGQATDGDTASACRLTISGNTLDFRGADTNDWYKGTFTLKEDTTPKQFIATITECGVPEYNGKQAHAIYQIEAGTLTMAANEPGNPKAPSGFDAPDIRKVVLKKK